MLEYAIHALNWLVIVFSLYWAAKILTRPEIERKHIVRNSIQMHVESEKHLNSSDRIVLMKKQLDLIIPEDVPPWQQHAYVIAVLEKFGFTGNVKKC